MQDELITQQPNTEVQDVMPSDGETKPDDTPILRVEHLKKYFPIQTSFFGKPTKYLRAVDDITFDVERGKTIGVVGESGCGKTTLGRTILKLYESDGGKIIFDGDDITGLTRSQMIKYRTDIQLIFQDPYSSLPPRMTVGAIIAEAVRVHKIVPKEEVHDYVMDVMKKCGLKPQHYDRYPHEFSGGQRQRICIARALAVKPKLVICDEPVSALDVSIQAQIINLLKNLQKRDELTYVFISHDLSVVKYITDNILVMYLGNAMEMSETEELFENPLHPYTKALFSAVPAPNPRVKMKRIMLEGDIPSPANPPDGCKFHTRCAECMNVCKFKSPEYREVKPGHFVACHLYNEDVMNNLDSFEPEYAEYVKQKEEARKKAELDKLKKRHPFTWKKRLEKQEEQEKAEEDEKPEAPEAPAPDIKEPEPEKPEAPAAEEKKAEAPVETAEVNKEAPAFEQAATEVPAEEKAPEAPAEEKAAPAVKKTARKPAVKKPAEKPEGEADTEAEKQEEKPAAKKPAASKTTAKKPAASKPAAAKSAASKTAASKTAAKPAASKTAASKTAAKKPAAKKPAAKPAAEKDETK